MNHVFNSSIKRCNQGVVENEIRCASELMFTKHPATPKMERHPPFNKKLTKQVAQAESLHLYHQLDSEDLITNGRNLDVPDPNTLPKFSFSDPPSPSSTGIYI